MRVEKLLKRLKHEFIKVNLIQASLDSLLFFLTSNLVLFLLDQRITSSFTNAQILGFLTLLFLAGDLYYRAKNYSLEIYEEKNPELEEVLRTARDNLDQQNIVSQALFDDLMDRARKVTSESIIPSRQIIQKILAVGILSFLTVMSGITNFQLNQDNGEILPSVDEVTDTFQDEEEEEFKLKNSSKIFGDEEDINASNLMLDFNITGEGEQGENRDIGAEADSEQLRLDATPETLNEDLELAKKYSLAVKNLEE